MIQLNENNLAHERPQSVAPHRQAPSHPYPFVPSSASGRPQTQAAPKATSQRPAVTRRSKDDALRLAGRLKRSLAASALVGFGALSLAVGGRVVTAHTSTSAAAPSSQASSSGNSQSSGSSGFSFFSSSSSSASPSSSTGAS